jgi:sulfur-oxidizing protein SoxZ|tara:strand:+ start:63 stop:440 length:378 start_codon:yes stop_codon:yes gene_type:complete
MVDRNRRIKITPNPAKRGDLLTIKALAEHEMEPGVRLNPSSMVVYPRFILNKLICRYNGVEVFVSDWYSGVSANPYISFNLRAEVSGEIEIEWVDDYDLSTYAREELLVIEQDSKIQSPAANPTT